VAAIFVLDIYECKLPPLRRRLLPPIVDDGVDSGIGAGIGTGTGAGAGVGSGVGADDIPEIAPVVALAAELYAPVVALAAELYKSEDDFFVLSHIPLKLSNKPPPLLFFILHLFVIFIYYVNKNNM